MYRYALIALTGSILFFGCRKDNSTNLHTTPPVDVQDSTYILTGVADVSFSKPKETKSLTLSLTTTSAKQERITLSAEGLPEGVTASYNPASGTLPFDATLSLVNNFGKAGTYDITVKGTSDAGASKSLKFKLTVPSYTCVDQIMDKISGITLLVPAGVSLPVNPPSSGQGYLEFSNLYVETFEPNTPGQYSTALNNVKATINCDNNTITINEATYTTPFASPRPSYTYTYSGSGTFSLKDRTFTINYTVKEGGRTMNYTINATL